MQLLGAGCCVVLCRHTCVCTICAGMRAHTQTCANTQSLCAYVCVCLCLIVCVSVCLSACVSVVCHLYIPNRWVNVLWNCIQIIRNIFLRSSWICNLFEFDDVVHFDFLFNPTLIRAQFCSHFLQNRRQGRRLTLNCFYCKEQNRLSNFANMPDRVIVKEKNYPKYPLKTNFWKSGKEVSISTRFTFAKIRLIG